MKPSRMHRSYQFVSRIAAGDTEREGPAGQRGSLFTICEADRAASAQPMAGAKPRGPRARARGPDAAGRLPGFIPTGEGRRGGSASVSLRTGGPCGAGPVRRRAMPRHLQLSRRSAPLLLALARRAGASVARSTRYASTRLPRLARPATLARPRGGFVRHSYRGAP